MREGGRLFVKHKKEKGSAHLSDLSWVARGVQGQRAAAKEDGRPTDPLADRRRAPCGLVTYPRLTLRRLSPGRDPLLSRCARAPRVTRKSVSSFRPATPPPSPVFEVLCRDSFVVFLDKKAHFSYYFFEAHLFFFLYKSPCLVFFFFLSFSCCPLSTLPTRTGSDSEGTPQKKRRRDEQRRRAARFGDGDGVDGRRGSEGGEGGRD